MATGLLILAAWFAASTLAVTVVARYGRRTRRIPAATDNQPGTDNDALTACRRIAAQTAARKEKPQP